MYFEIYSDKNGHWRWRLVAENNRIIADSGEGYVRRDGAVWGISLVKGAFNVPVRG